MYFLNPKANISNSCFYTFHSHFCVHIKLCPTVCEDYQCGMGHRMATGSGLHEVGAAMCQSGSSGTTPERALSDCGPAMSDEEESTFRYKYVHIMHEIFRPRDSQSNTTQHNTTHPRQLFFQRNNELSRAGLEPATFCVF